MSPLQRLGAALVRGALRVRPLSRPRSEGPSGRRAVPTAAFAFLAGALAGLPLYGAFQWYDLFTHAVGGAAVAATIALALRGAVAAVGGVALVAVAWELFERLVPLAALPVHVPTADWRSDVAATVAGGALFVVAGAIATLLRE